MFKLLIVALLWWWFTYVREDDSPLWRQTYVFTNMFMILFMVGWLIIGPVFSVYTASNHALNAASASPYFSEMFGVSKMTGLILGLVAGLIALKNELKKQASEKNG